MSARGRRSKRFSLVVIVCALFSVAPVGVGATNAAPVAPAAVDLLADFSVNNGPGHPDVFGSAINQLDEKAKIDTLQQSGSRFIRRDAYLNEIVPPTTVENYRNNVGGVADPNNWRWNNYTWVDEYHKRGFKIMLIMAYSTSWLGYDCRNIPDGDCYWHSVPRAWDVYEDIVRKIYLRFQGKVDLVEIWNEPDEILLNLVGSPYPEDPVDPWPRVRAYQDIYYHAARAIRSVDASIPIGGPALAQRQRNDVWVPALLQDPRIGPYVDFLSYHHYDFSGANDAESVATWRRRAAEAGRGPDFPLYVTEWNWPGVYTDPMAKDHPNAISAVADRLTSLLKLHVNGANFFADNDEANNVEPLEKRQFGVYANGTLRPQSRAFRLLSHDLGLGAGTSTLRAGYGPAGTSVGAATTANGDNVVWVVNDGTAPFDADLAIHGLGGVTSLQANIFEASPNQAVVSPKSTVPLTVSGGATSVRFEAPAKSVVGVRLTPYPIADAENLAPGASVTASSVLSGFPATHVRDGIIGVSPQGEWVSNAELNPWLQLTWPTSQTIGRVVLYDRDNALDQIRGGTLTFSDGSSVHVPALPNDGTGKAISFPARTVTWVRFQVTGGAGANVGLSEIQVHRAANIAPEGTVTTSSQFDTGAHAHSKAVDGIVGQATGEWASAESNPWIRVDWVNVRSINEVAIHDRSSTASNANGGTLWFSDGSSIAVAGIPANGAAKLVSFPAKSVNWVRFQVAGGAGAYVGLSELRVNQAANVASSAAVTVSSQFPDPAYGPAAATDGIVNQRYTGEWASNGERAPWIQLTWPSSQPIGQVVLYDRNNLIDSANGGTLSFSDGSSIAVGGMDNSGVGKVVAFPRKTVTWVRFQVTGAAPSSPNVGLSEFEVFPDQPAAGSRQVGMWYSTWYTAKRRWVWTRGHGVDSTKKMLGDVNGDGRADSVIMFADGPLRGKWFVALSNGNGFDGWTEWGAGHGEGSHNQLLGDVNGDGRADAVVVFTSGDLRGNWYVALSTGSGFTPYGWWGAGHGEGSSNQMLGDVNGDNRDDAVVFFDSGNLAGNWYVALSNGAGFNFYEWWGAGHGVGSAHRMLGDVNGDNRDDAVVYFNSGNYAGDWYAADSTGSRFTDYYQWKDSHLGSHWFSFVGDVDADRSADAVTFNNSDGSWRVLPRGFMHPAPMNLWDAWNIRYLPIVGGVPRQYDSADPAAIEEQLRMIAGAGVDFVIFDLTNNVGLNDPPHPPILSNTLAVCAQLNRLRGLGVNLRYAIAIGGARFGYDNPSTPYEEINPAVVENEAGFVTDRFVNNAACGGPGSYYHYEGKPLLVSYLNPYGRHQWEQHPDHARTSTFTVRFIQGTTPEAAPGYPSSMPNGGCGTPPLAPSPPYSEAGIYFGWGMPFGSLPNATAMTVMPGWNNKHGHFVSRTQYGSPTGFFTACGWDRVLAATPKPGMVVVNSFNEFAEETAVQPADTSQLDGASERWPNPTAYWDLTRQRIGSYRSAQ